MTRLVFYPTLFFISVFSQLVFCQLNNNYPNQIDINYRGMDYSLINDMNPLTFDTKNAKVRFHFPKDDVNGSIGGMQLALAFNPEDTDNSKLSGTALVETLETGNFLRDGHLMWKKFFYKKKYPKIQFSSSQIVPFDDGLYKVIGLLNIKGVQKEVIINFHLMEKALIGKTTIYTSDFGIAIYEDREENQLDITFEFPILK